MEAALKKVWENIEAHLQDNVKGEDHSSNELLIPIAPNSDPDIKEIVIAVLRGDKPLRKRRGKR